MTTLTYRGIAYTPTSGAPSPARPKPMMYRGVAHDGLPERSLRFAALMLYRGVEYVVDANGARIATGEFDGDIAAI